MIVTLATPIAEEALTRSIGEACNAEIRVCGMEDIAECAPAGDVLVLPGMWYSPAVATALADPSSRCRHVQFLSAGYDRLDEAPRPPDVRFARVVGLWGTVTAEHAMALILALTRRLPDAMAAQSTREWRDCLRSSMTTIEGASVAIIGTGEVGSAISTRLRCFGADVIGISRTGAPNCAFTQTLTIDRAGPALAVSDIVVIAVPYTSETAAMVDGQFFDGLKRGALFVNISRGGVVDQLALHAALANAHLAGAAIDVTEPEPLPSDNPLWAAPNLLITPHVGGGAAPRFYEHLAAYVAGNCARWYAKELPNGAIA